MQVRELMTEDPLVLAVDHPLQMAELLMAYAHIRHLPVVDDSRVVGIVTHRDLLRYATEVIEETRSERTSGIAEIRAVGTIMQSDVRTIEADADARSAIDIMIDQKLGCLPVVQENQLVGIITEADFLKYAKRCLDQGQP